METKKTIMVVDDNPDIITIVKTILEGRGYTVFSASSGPELLNMLPNQKPDLIILDIMMPEMDGLEVLTRLKGKSETATIPVICVLACVLAAESMMPLIAGKSSAIRIPMIAMTTSSSMSVKALRLRTRGRTS